MIKVITGFLMAMADSVPGVSGGTIAYIMGIYDKLIESVSNLTVKEKRKESIKFLIPLGIAWVVGFIFSILLVSKLIENNIFKISSLFLGFIIISIFITLRNEKDILKGNLKNIWLTIVGIIIVVVVAYFGTTLTASSSTDVTLFTYIYLFFAGAVAIACMLLPGISGSTMLLIFGVYYLVIDSAKQLLTFYFTALPVVLSVVLGILFGAIFAVKLINYLFKNYRVQIIYFINGLLIGSIYAIIVGPYSVANEYLTIDTFSILWFIIGMLIIITIDRLSKIFN